MAIYKSKNPALNVNVFEKVRREKESTDVMTIQGTVNKISLLGLIVFVSAGFTWYLFETSQKIVFYHNVDTLLAYTLGGSILGFLVAIVIIIKKSLAQYLAPVYCVFEGVALGGVSIIMDSEYPGIVLQALLLTFGILFSLVLIYRLGLIKATENFKLVIASATAGIAMVYLMSFIGGFFNFDIPLIHDNGFWGILFSLFVVLIAALNLVVDFDFIENGAESNAPKYMEWYAAFGLMVTLIWLYLEILRLLSKFHKNKTSDNES